MNLVLILAIVLVVVGNVIAAVRSIRENKLPDPLFLVVDGVAILFVLGGVLR